MANSFVSSLDCENSTKISNKMFRSRKYTVLDSFRFVQKIPVTPSSEGILLLDDKILSEIAGHRQRLEMQQKKLKEAEEKEKNEKIERMKQGPAENMTVAVLKPLLKDKGIAFSSKAKKSDLAKIFNTQACTRHNNVTLSWLHVKRLTNSKSACSCYGA